MATPDDQSKPAEIFTPADAASPDAPKSDAETAASARKPADEPITIEPRALILTDRTWSDTSDDHPAAAAAATDEAPASKRLMPIAAGLAIALTIGAMAGATATFTMTHDNRAPSAEDPNRALRESQARLESELAALKTTIASGQRASTAQIGKLTERVERAEKAQAEPTAKIAKMAESLDRVERRLPTTVAPPLPPPAPVAGDITGSIAAKSEAKPPIAEGWHVLDSYAGRAVVESRNGRVFEVGPGSNLPGLGRVEAIKRENGRVVVVTRNGVIAALPDGRRTRFLYED